MWESKDQAIDVNYNAEELWFVGVYGQPVAKPNEIRKWEENTKFFKLLDKTYPDLRSLSPIPLPNLSSIKEEDEDRIEGSKTFEVETQSEKSAQTTKEHD
jgi:hypothetical protein